MSVADHFNDLFTNDFFDQPCCFCGRFGGFAGDEHHLQRVCQW